MKNDTLSEIAYKEIKQDILTGVYAPNERLLIEKVSEKLGISMTPLKDAFRMLEREGLVQSVPRKGTFVTEISSKDVFEYCQIRLSLESLAVDLICDDPCRIDDSSMENLEKLNKKVEKALRSKNKKNFITFDSQFHLAIAKLSGNERLVDMLSFYPLSNFLVMMGGGVMSLDDGDKIVGQHDAIIKALKRLDREEIKRQIKENIFVFHTQQLNS